MENEWQKLLLKTKFFTYKIIRRVRNNYLGQLDRSHFSFRRERNQKKKKVLFRVRLKNGKKKTKLYIDNIEKHKMLYIYMNRMGQAPLCYHKSSDSDSLISYFINFSWDWCHDRIWTNCTNNCKIRSKLSFSMNFFYIILHHSTCFHRYLKIFEKCSLSTSFIIASFSSVQSYTPPPRILGVEGLNPPVCIVKFVLSNI